MLGVRLPRCRGSGEFHNSHGLPADSGWYRTRFNLNPFQGHTNGSKRNFDFSDFARLHHGGVVLLKEAITDGNHIQRIIAGWQILESKFAILIGQGTLLCFDQSNRGVCEWIARSMTIDSATDLPIFRDELLGVCSR